MLEGLIAAILMLFGTAPKAATAAAEPTPIVSFNSGPKMPSYSCKSPPMLFIRVTGPDQVEMRYSSPNEDLRYTVAPADLKAALEREGPLGRAKVFIGASDDVPYRYVTGQIAYLQALGVRSIVLIESFDRFIGDT
jgi:hypothetical protein